MAGETLDKDLIDVVVRLPRATIAQSLRTPRDTVDSASSTAHLVLATAILASRSHRRELFAGVRFGEPAWDMILELYVAAQDGRPINVTRLCAAGGKSMTTGLRHLEELEAHGYVLREADGTDARSNLVVIQPVLLQAVEAWLDFLTDMSKCPTR